MSGLYVAKVTPKHAIDISHIWIRDFETARLIREGRLPPVIPL